jgi:hypothetical protein
MREMFERLGFTPGAAASLEGNEHGIITLEEVVFLNDKDIDSLVKQLRHPGGLLLDLLLLEGLRRATPDLWLITLANLCPSGLKPISSWQCYTYATKHIFQEVWRLQVLH